MRNTLRDSSWRVVSIPSKYKPADKINNMERTGFSSQTKRFIAAHKPVENPGPGSYNISGSKDNCPSFSTRGTSGFVTATAVPPELLCPQRRIPGPNAYSLPSTLTNRHDFNTGLSRVFRASVAQRQDRPKNQTPAPNQYLIQNGGSDRFSPSGSSAFVSKTKRNPYDVKADLPSPCQYYVEDDFRRASKVVRSPFRSTTQRLVVPKANNIPGPGAYSLHLSPVPAPRPRPLCSSIPTLSAPSAIVPKPPPSPGPGHYDLCRDISFKSTVPSAAFASRSERTTGLKRTDSPGPGFYDPLISSKQSFFYNDSKIWLPF